MMDAFVEGVPTLEVRWILPGQLDAAVAGWLSGCPPEVESREDVMSYAEWLRRRS